jgi:hypothetical protein
MQNVRSALRHLAPVQGTLEATPEVQHAVAAGKKGKK